MTSADVVVLFQDLSYTSIQCIRLSTEQGPLSSCSAWLGLECSGDPDLGSPCQRQDTSKLPFLFP